MLARGEDSRVNWNSGFERRIVTVEKLESYEAVFTICSTGSVSTHQDLISNQAVGGRCSRGISRLSNKELKKFIRNTGFLSGQH